MNRPHASSARRSRRSRLPDDKNSKKQKTQVLTLRIHSASHFLSAIAHLRPSSNFVRTLRIPRNAMLSADTKPISVGELLVKFLEPRGLTATDLAARCGLPRKHVHQLCRDQRAVTADTARILANVFGNSADFWLNTQDRTDRWEGVHKAPGAERMAWALPLDSKTRRARRAQRLSADIADSRPLYGLQQRFS
jgi:addiction module HigA family antidote